MDIWLLLVILSSCLWVGAFLLRLVVIPRSSLSAFELSRRATSGDQTARDEQDKESLAPRVIALQNLLGMVLLVLAVATSLAAYGWWVGTVVSLVIVALLGISTRSGMLKQFANMLYKKLEPTVLKYVKNWPWLERLGYAPDNSSLSVGSKAELQRVIDQSGHVLSKEQLVRLKAGLALDDEIVLDAMTPVSVVEVVDVEESLGPLVLDTLHKSGHSRFPVISGDVHHVVGMLYLHDVINLKSAKATVKDAMDEKVYFIHENQPLEKALHGFLRTHRHLFVVVNDYRETVGVLTLEDVLEVLLGKKIVDEFDRYDDLRAVAESNPNKHNLPEGKTDI